MSELSGSLTLEQGRDVLVRAVREATEDVAAGLHGVKLGNLDLQTGPEQVGLRFGTPPPHPQAVRARILAAGLRSCADGLGLAMTWAYREAALWTLPGRVARKADGILNFQGEVGGEQWNEVIVNGGLKFDRLTLPDKLEKLAALGLPELPFAGDIRSLNAARNCLVHRGGIVGPADLRDGRLVVSWRRIRLIAHGDDGERTIGIASRVEKGERVGVELEPVEQTYSLGDTVAITQEDFADMAQTYVWFAQQLGDAIQVMQRDRFDHQ